MQQNTKRHLLVLDHFVDDLLYSEKGLATEKNPLTKLHTTSTLYLYIFWSKQNMVTTSRRHVIALAEAWDKRWMPHRYYTHQNVQPDANPCSVINKGAVGHNYTMGQCSFQAITRCVSTAQRTILSDQGPPPNNTMPFPTRRTVKFNFHPRGKQLVLTFIFMFRL